MSGPESSSLKAIRLGVLYIHKTLTNLKKIETVKQKHRYQARREQVRNCVPLGLQKVFFTTKTG